jgi:ATP-binding cassette subfamily C protein
MTTLSRIVSILKRVYALVRPYGRKKLILLFLFGLAQGVLQVAGVTSIFPFLALVSDADRFRQSDTGSWLLERLPPMSDVSLLIWSGMFSVMIILLANAILLANEIYQARYCNGLGHWMRSGLLQRITSNPYDFFLRRNSGELLKKINIDVTVFITGILAPILFIAARIVIVVLMTLTLIAMNPVIALSAMFLIVGFYSCIFLLLNKKRKTSSRELKKAYRGMMREAQQMMNGIKPIKVHGVERFFLKRFSRHSLKEARLMQWLPVYQNTPRYFVEPFVLGGLIILISLLIAAGKDVNALLPTLGIMTFAAYRIMPNLQLLYSNLTTISVKMHALEEISEEFRQLEEPPTQGQESPSEVETYQLKNQIELNDVYFRYSKSKEDVLKNINLTIGCNEFVAVTGKTGSGKSSLIDLILSLHKPTGGRLLIDGKPLSQIGEKEWRTGIGYVPQDIFLLDDTISANIAFGLPESEIDRTQLRKVCATAQILDFIEEELPEKFSTRVGERGVRLSGGQRQRIGLARALYKNPSLLVFDEATSALDAETEASLMQAIENLHGKVTFIVIAHRLSTIEEADSVLELRNGQIERIR